LSGAAGRQLAAEFSGIIGATSKEMPLVEFAAAVAATDPLRHGRYDGGALRRRGWDTWYGSCCLFLRTGAGELGAMTRLDSPPHDCSGNLPGGTGEPSRGGLEQAPFVIN
jgi:hypothetical protein